MYNTLSLLLICSLNSPHHMGPRHMGMGPDNSVGMGHATVNSIQNNYTNTPDYELNFTESGNETGSGSGNETGSGSGNETGSESGNETGSGSGNENDFSLPIGIGASLGIVGLIISILAVRGNKKNNSDNIYIEPVIDLQRNDIITNPNYDSQSIEIIEDADGNYETICDTLYELAGENRP